MASIYDFNTCMRCGYVGQRTAVFERCPECEAEYTQPTEDEKCPECGYDDYMSCCPKCGEDDHSGFGTADTDPRLGDFDHNKNTSWQEIKAYIRKQYR